ncbi:glycosyl hydrolase family 18 protein [Paenibacillus sp. MER 99-2]|uniref:glycosyl hydrolase family 18 protein n=1 Tax=Paenibacillus sp. MER 99-2 TaxID=2939572 RepID=UPI00203A9079|nr:glycosyl hydrolase family 18 protein [Paenibacillus sp. MER 99-2]MCM3175445.1 glycosyl hydrolase family 18 protein [Paenibacillus sp. MER 99-2]
MSRKNRYTRQKRRSFWPGLLGACIVAGAAYWLITSVWLNPTYEEPDWIGMKQPIFVEGQRMEGQASGTGNELKLPVSVLQDVIDPGIRYEAATGDIIIASPQRVLHMKVGSTQAELNHKDFPMSVEPEIVGDEAYIPLKPLKEVYGIAIQEDSTTGAVLLMRGGDTIQYATVNTGSTKADKTVPLYKQGEERSPIIADMLQDDRVRVWQTGDEQSFVQLDNGYAGYMDNKNITLTEQKELDKPQFTLTEAEKKWQSKPVNLVWEAVYNRQPDIASIGKLPGVNVVSPTWFHITDGQGSLRSKADKSYVNWAHRSGMEVWGLMDNSFDPDITKEAMASYETRTHIIEQMLTYAQTYQLDGINIDFENVYTDDGPNITQFVREIKAMARIHGLMLSVDVTPKSNSEMWSAFLDRRSLGAFADYIVVMAYDEHWAASPKAGSVASLPWTEASMRRILEEDEVPANKLIMAVPLYTRIWTEEKNEQGEVKVSSKAVGMNTVTDLIKEKKLKPVLDQASGQNYVEYEEDGATKKIWIEDAVSLQARVDLIDSLELGGVAAWNRSFANASAWEVLKQAGYGK